VTASNANKVLTFRLSLVLNVIDIGGGWSGEAMEVRGEEIRRWRMFADEPPRRAERKQRSEGCCRREAEETMAASWTVEVLVDGWRNRRWGREEVSGCGASDSSSW
jgi:hypothetical protein